MRHVFTAALAALGLATPLAADPPVIERITASQTGQVWRFDVTLSHPDTGWDDYADGWRVLTPDGVEHGLRVLAHPHVTEQPFTRSLSGVALPPGTSQVLIEARDSVGGWSGAPVPFDLPVSD